MKLADFLSLRLPIILGTSSRNTYARYEQGRSVPTIEKLVELLHVVCPATDIVINESTIS